MELREDDSDDTVSAVEVQEAKRMYPEQKLVHEGIASSVPAEKIVEWEALSLAPTENKKNQEVD
ncbi:hypothetical protein FRC07_003582 [Ceratobasidium sp. 392]|nr:hypothetical protein FRC07_003582 [Ceratobasidium sp. 392]